MFRFLMLIDFQDVFLNFVCYFVFWVVISEISFFFSKFTTIGNTSWFGDFVFWVEDFVKFRLKMDDLALWIFSFLRYSKTFNCRPCHTFWICLAAHLFVFHPFFALIMSLVTYKRIKRICCEIKPTASY